MTTDAASLAEYLNARRAEIDAALERWLPAPPECPPIICAAMRYSVVPGGKRLRPALTLAAAETTAVAARGDNEGARAEARALALPAACAVELIHTYSLIHDDLPAMDNDTLRRGRPTLHVVHGEAMAILAGDGLHALAFALMAREPVTSDAAIARRKLRAIDVVAEAAGPRGMVGGQAIDLHAADGRLTLDADGLQRMHRMKTAALIRAATCAGAIMAGAPEPLAAALDRYATRLGLAFQIVDDILDVEGADQELGKTAGKDARAGKPTYPSLYGLVESRRLAASALEEARAALKEAGLVYGRLYEIADWVGMRRS